MKKRTKIIATLGPASSKLSVMEKLVKEGADVFRINFSHGEYSEHEVTIAKIRELETKMSRYIPILQDLQGPKIRVGMMPKGGVELIPRTTVKIVARKIVGYDQTIPTDYEHLPQDVKKGSTILMADGVYELKVLEINGDEVECRVVRGGRLTSHKGINLPGVPVSAPAMTEKDIADLKFGLARGVDFVAISFV